MSESEQIITHSKKHITLVIVMTIMIVIASTVIVYFYIQNTLLESNKANLQDEISNLQNDLMSLQSQVSNLQGDYNNLKAMYDSLKIDYDQLEDDYDELEADYVFLLDYFFDRPIESKVTPSTQSLQDWLQKDSTDQMFSYADPNFVCVEFAIILSTNARAENFDMGVVAVWGHLQDTKEVWTHAFDAIITKEGLVYVEPQTDEVWWYPNHQEIMVDQVYDIEGDNVYVEDIAIVLTYQ